MNKKQLLLAALFPLLVNLLGCQTILSISHSDFVSKKGQTVSAFQSKAGFLYLVTPDLSVRESLGRKCPGGVLTGVEAVTRMRDFWIVQVYDLEASAICQDPVLAK